jgi:hypothetical protein
MKKPNLQNPLLPHHFFFALRAIRFRATRGALKAKHRLPTFFFFRTSSKILQHEALPFQKAAFDRVSLM